jgi:hypothetical protein
MHDPASNNTRITADTAGVYVVTASVFLSAAISTRGQLVLNRVTSGGSATAIEVSESSGGFGLSVTSIVNLAAAEYVTVGFYHESGTNRTIQAASYFSAAWVGQTS